MPQAPELILIVCEGKTEALYFSILQRAFRLPTKVKIMPDPNSKKYKTFGQHETLFQNAADQRQKFTNALDVNESAIETWAVCDRDSYKGSYPELEKQATSLNVNLAFSDPQFENFILQHFSANKSKSSGATVEQELSQCIAEIQPNDPLYHKNSLSWLKDMIDQKHAVVRTAIHNASVHSNHTKQPFFTVHRLVDRLLALVK